MEKTCWSRHLAEVIHNISFQPKEYWANICILIKGENIHHSSPRTVHMRLPSGNLETTYEDNVKLFSVHLGKC